MSGKFRSNLKANAFPALQKTDDLEEILNSRIAGRPQHSQQTLGRNVRCLGDFGKADGRIDVITQDGFAGRGIAGKQVLDPFPQEFLAKLLVADRARGSFP
jgi:hypothetical protein